MGKHCSKKNASISRELPDSAINGISVIQGSGYGRAEGENIFNLFFRFDTDTRAARTAGRPLLLIASNAVYARNMNDSIVTIRVMLNLTSLQAQSLLEGIQVENIKKSIDRSRRQSDLFK